MTVNLISVITCPYCGHKKREQMPEGACIWYYSCEQCETLIRPLPGDCCVFCSYGDQPCPPIQQSGSCCGTEIDKEE